MGEAPEARMHCACARISLSRPLTADLAAVCLASYWLPVPGRVSIHL